MPRSFANKQSWALILIGICCLGIVIGSFALTSNMLKANWWVNHTLEVMREADDSLLCLVDCETAYRGFLVTAEDQYLEPYDVCEKHIFSHLEKLKSLTSDNASQQTDMSRLEVLAREKVRFSANAIAMRRQHPETRAKDVVDLAPGKKLMDEFRVTVKRLQDREEQLYKERTAAAGGLRDAMYAAVALMALAVCASIVWIAVTTRRFTTGQLESQAMITESRDVALRANELKSQFVANVSHEIRTPLSGILGMSELILRGETDSDKRDMMQHVYKSALSLLSIVNDLLDFSKLEAGRITLQVEPYDLRTLVNEVVQSILLTAQSKHLEIETEIDPSLDAHKVLGDADRLRQVLLNLTHNAVKFTGEGSVKISVTRQKDAAGEKLRFAVSDTGIGISPEQVARLFQPFVQADGSTSRKYGGTGLGLSISKKIIDLMAGDIGVESQGEGKGSTFWYTVPLEFASSPVGTGSERS